MSIQQKKYKRLRKELQFLQSELEYVEEVLKEWHLVFEKYHRDYCKREQIDLNKLNKIHKKKIEQVIPKPIIKETGVVLYKKDESVFKKIYKKMARQLHPDVGGDEAEFKQVTSAMQQKNFEKLLDICDKHVIFIDIDEEVIALLQQQISDTKQKIKREKSTYSWLLYSCADESCKDNVIKKFLKHLFNYQGA
jgi:hypothetical protein